MLTSLYSHCRYTLSHVSTLKGESSGSTDMFCEQGQQNTCPDVSTILNSSVLCVMLQSDNCYITHNTPVSTYYSANLTFRGSCLVICSYNKTNTILQKITTNALQYIFVIKPTRNTNFSNLLSE